VAVLSEYSKEQGFRPSDISVILSDANLIQDSEITLDRKLGDDPADEKPRAGSLRAGLECGVSVSAKRGSKQRIRWASSNGASLSDTLGVFRESLREKRGGPCKESFMRDPSLQ
jgi:hypothetical protein